MTRRNNRGVCADAIVGEGWLEKIEGGTAPWSHYKCRDEHGYS